MKHWADFIIKGISPARLLMLRGLEEKVDIVAPCIDLGGGKQTYLDLFEGAHGVRQKVVLADRTYETDIINNLEDGFLFSDAKFKIVLMLNVIEYVFNFKKLCNEFKRVITQIR